jgi:hypothetical protein
LDPYNQILAKSLKQRRPSGGFKLPTMAFGGQVTIEGVDSEEARRLATPRCTQMIAIVFEHAGCAICTNAWSAGVNSGQKSVSPDRPRLIEAVLGAYREKRTAPLLWTGGAVLRVVQVRENSRQLTPVELN